MNEIKLRPHHFLDVIRDYGNDKPLDAVHPWGAPTSEVREKVVSDIDQFIIMVSRVDTICEPCSKLENGICVAVLKDNSLMREYNDDLDDQLFKKLKLEKNQKIKIKDLLLRIKDNLEDILDLFTRGDNEIRLKGTMLALEKFRV